tara:strand:+ start:461 stop:949 length:489 start_codon:yes stop_codon:yes gene_type:complete
MSGKITNNNFSRASGRVREDDPVVGVPANVIAHRASGESTPSGWSEYETARGRMIIGLPSGGTDGGTVGTAFTNSQNKSKSIAHTHKMGFGISDGSNNKFSWQGGGTYGTSGTFTANRRDTTASETCSASCDNYITDAMSANDTFNTGDVCAYIQLMTIKKD